MASALHQELFDPDAYLTDAFSFCEARRSRESRVASWYEWALGKFHQFYSTLNSDSAVRKRLHILEFGGGPVIYPLISAAPYVETIVFSEFVGRNRDVVASWRNRKATPSIANIFRSLIQYAVQSVEGRDEEEVQRREQELLDKIISVVPCDIRQDPPVDASVRTGMYDVLSTHLCLVTACESVEMYAEALRKLSAYVRPGGYILTLEVLEQTFYTVGDARFPCVALTKEIVRKSLIGAGFTEELCFHSLPVEPSEAFDAKEFVMFSARKCH